MRRALAIALMSTLSACGGGPGATSFGGVTQADVSTAGSDESTTGSSSSGPAAAGSSSTSSTSSTSTTSTGDSIVWDMGMPDFGPQQPAGCEGKIDFLFVISAQGTMKNDQERLIASFPGFMDAIKEQLADFDIHILVADPDETQE